ncbi:phosphonopyruvate decarboxylase [Halorhodospira halochloris]|uniref:phosphonopyruvate decarboxylase n=1 Tax=Halorhodospira halochloris TaxID=1052 RepID=UPI001EE7D129|nr:phosphonopyruvate decarboxylase [Halorhodospira halochloris]MCG5548893.1 phosphonopyruvate decarboxylase [Halorhodospira halochloris]
MIEPGHFYDTLAENGVDFVTGVPDSLLKEFNAYIATSLPEERHLIAANEGTAVGAATGSHLATGGVPLVYMQNSGLGNSVNPLLSLCDPEVYATPLVLLIGWRGEPGVADEPQHIKQGRVSPALLEAMEIPFVVLDAAEAEQAAELARWAVAQARKRSGPVALLARKGAFASSPQRPAAATAASELGREQAIETLVESLPTAAMIVATTGHISRELYEYRKRAGGPTGRDFLTVGSMGHSSQIALGIALQRPDRTVVCLDGDGAALMHMGGLASIGARRPGNFYHIVLNNGVHDSVGSQPTVAQDIDLTGVARACSYRVAAEPVCNQDDLERAGQSLTQHSGPAFLEVWVQPGARADLGRPAEPPAENKKHFQAFLHGPGGHP